MITEDKAGTTGEMAAVLSGAAVALAQAVDERIEVDDSEWYWVPVEQDLKHLHGQLEAGRMFVDGDPEREAIFERAVAMVNTLVAEVEAAVERARG